MRPCLAGAQALVELAVGGEPVDELLGRGADEELHRAHAPRQERLRDEPAVADVRRRVGGEECRRVRMRLREELFHLRSDGVGAEADVPVPFGRVELAGEDRRVAAELGQVVAAGDAQADPGRLEDGSLGTGRTTTAWLGIITG